MRTPIAILLGTALVGAVAYSFIDDSAHVPELVRLSSRSSEWVKVLHRAEGRLVSERAVMRRAEPESAASAEPEHRPDELPQSFDGVTLLGEPSDEQQRYIRSIAEGLLESRGDRFAKLQQLPLDGSPWRAFQELRASHMMVEAVAVNDALESRSYFLVAGGLTPPTADDAAMVTMSLSDDEHGTATCCFVLPYETYPTLSASARALAESRRALGDSLRLAVNGKSLAERRDLLRQAAHAQIHRQIREARVRIDADSWTLL